MRLFQVVDETGRKPRVGMPVISRSVGLSRLGRRGLAYTYWSHVNARRETIRILKNGLIGVATAIPLASSCIGCELHAILKSIATTRRETVQDLCFVRLLHFSVCDSQGRGTLECGKTRIAMYPLEPRRRPQFARYPLINDPRSGLTTSRAVTPLVDSLTVPRWLLAACHLRRLVMVVQRRSVRWHQRSPGRVGDRCRP
jgi:hypothetical protein